MKRGEIWTLQADGYASKPRPVVIVQSDAVDRFDSVITCLLTSYDSSDIDTRVRLEPSPERPEQSELRDDGQDRHRRPQTAGIPSRRG